LKKTAIDQPLDQEAGPDIDHFSLFQHHQVTEELARGEGACGAGDIVSTALTRVAGFMPWALTAASIRLQ
jgi:hypothetical protein